MCMLIDTPYDICVNGTQLELNAAGGGSSSSSKVSSQHPTGRWAVVVTSHERLTERENMIDGRLCVRRFLKHACRHDQLHSHVPIHILGRPSRVEAICSANVTNKTCLQAMIRSSVTVMIRVPLCRQRLPASVYKSHLPVHWQLGW